MSSQLAGVHDGPFAAEAAGPGRWGARDADDLPDDGSAGAGKGGEHRRPGPGTPGFGHPRPRGLGAYRGHGFGGPRAASCFLYMLARVTRARRILEIGTLGGYSAIWLGRASGRRLPVDARNRSASCKIARRNLARAMLLGTVEVREGPAEDLLQHLVEGGEEPFDLIFIDADKEAYLEYFELSLKLSRPGTLIVADNVVRYGAVIDPAAAAADTRVAGIKRVPDALAKHPGVDDRLSDRRNQRPRRHGAGACQIAGNAFLSKGCRLWPRKRDARLTSLCPLA